MDELARERRRFWQMTGATMLVLVVVAAVFVALVFWLLISAAGAIDG